MPNKQSPFPAMQSSCGRETILKVDDLTANEIEWVTFLRVIGNGRDLRPTLRRIQLLRRVCRRG